MGLADPAGGVDLVGEDHQDAQIASLWGSGDLDGCEQVSWPVGAGQRGIAHRSGDHHRRPWTMARWRAAAG